jgi:pyruvate dehydrogenase E1 component alpha subunit
LTYRWQGHNVGDPGAYRDPEEVAAWKAKEPLILLKNKNLLSTEDIRDIEEKAEKDVKTAKQFAVDSPYPPVEEAYADVFSAQ